MTDSIARQQVPVSLAYRHADRAQVLATMIEDLVQKKTPLKTKSLSDPTVALLDAWATVADIIDFYQERIATESYLTTAIEPESVLALANLLGYRPRPGLAATCWLAYTLVPDPTDTAVLLPQHQLVQSVPGAGELPQTFETTEDLVARPSWNTLPIKNTTPLQIVDTATQTYQTPPQLVVSGTVPLLQPNDVLLITPTTSIQGTSDCVVGRVDHTSTDLTTNTMTVALQQQVSPAAPQQDGAPDDVVRAMINLVKPLKKPPSVPPTSQTDVKRDPAKIFPGAPTGGQLPDVSAKLLTALQPGLAKALYPALASSTIGEPQVSSVQALGTTTAPFGVQIPPRAQFDSQGQPLTPEDWPLNDNQTVRITLDESVTAAMLSDHVPAQDFSGATVRFDGLSYHDSVTINNSTTTLPSGAGSITVSSTDSTASTPRAKAPPSPSNKLEFTQVAAGLDEVSVTLTADANGDGQIKVDSAGAEVVLGVDMTGTTTTSASAGPLYVTTAIPPRFTLDSPVRLVIDVVTAIAVSPDQRVTLYLNERHDEVVAGSYVMIEDGSQQQPPPPAADPLVVQVNPQNQQDQNFYPVVTQVVSASPVTVNRYGMSATVTSLQLQSDWISENTRLLSDLRPLIVHAQSIPLDLLPTPRTDTVMDNTIEVDGLYPGLETGHRLLITGTRADQGLGDATVPDGETVMVSGVAQTTNPVNPGDSPYSTITLATALSYTYQRDTVTLYGNVVPAHHGATVTETLTATGDPAHPMFTLAQTPVLADPSGTAAGFVSSLTLVIDGRIWTQVARMDDDTPPRCYITGTDGQGRATITLGQPLPQPASTVTATYRSGVGSAGNVSAGQLTQLLTRPLAVATVTNPLPASGGSDPDGPDSVRSRAPLGLQALGRVVSVQDTADLALSWAGIGKTTAATRTDGQRDTVTVTVAGATPDPLDPEGTLISDLSTALAAAGDVTVPITAVPAAISLIVLVAEIRHDPNILWDDVEPAVRAELTDSYGYDQRGIDEAVILSDLIAVIHRVDGVLSCAITQIGLIPYTIDPAALAAFSPQPPPNDGTGLIPVTGVAYLSDSVAETLILQEVQP